MIAKHSGTKNLRYVFADTGIEDQKTYDHLDYLEEDIFCQKIERLKANFAQEIAQKRMYVDFVWRSEGVSNAVCDAALDVLHPTGIPFLDLCLWKGRFPGHASAAFCTFELKQKPMEKYQDYLLRNITKNLIVWQGTRREESLKRRNLTPWEAIFGDIYERTGHLVHRPIVYWSEKQVFDFCARFGAKVNPLYREGFKRVGCMPCKNEAKQSIRLIAERYPIHVEKIEEFELLVSIANKGGVSTFFDGRTSANFLNDPNIITSTHGIRAHIAWAKSSKAGRHWQGELFFGNECSLAGYCE